MSIEPSPDLSLSLPPDPSREVPEAVTPLSEREIVTALDVGHVVDRVATRMTDSEIRDALRRGHVMAFGREPSDERLAMAWAMVCLETGRGSYLWCWNFGNQDALPGEPRFALTAREVIGGKDVMLTKWLRACVNADDGADRYWRRLHASYGRALSWFDTESPADVAGQLKTERYYTGSLVEYATAVTSLVIEYHRRWPQ